MDKLLGGRGWVKSPRGGGVFSKATKILVREKEVIQGFSTRVANMTHLSHHWVHVMKSDTCHKIVLEEPPPE